MDVIYTVLLAIVQGVTEFAPVSSSGHLVLLHEWLSLNVSSELAFDVALHAGTLLAILGYFAKDIIHYIRKSHKVIWLLVLSSIPAGVVGFLFESFIDDVLRSVWVVVVMLIVVAVWFFIVEKRAVPSTSIETMSYTQACIIGCAQILALIPGTSRSGVTISTGMLLGLKRDAAARFSFLMAVPVLGGATLKKTIDVFQAGVGVNEIQLLVLGIIISGLSGIIVIRYLLQFFQKHSLRPFAWYRIGLALVVTLVILL